MKKNILLLLLSISYLSSINAQTNCIDTLLYPQAKATSFLGVTCNAPSEFAGYSQYYDAPQDVTIKGFKVYMGVNSQNPADIAAVTGYLMEANPDSSVGTILIQKDFSVTNTYTLINIDSMAYHVIFDNPITVSSGFHIAVRTETTLPLAIISNDHNAGDGQGEELGYWYWTQDSTWYKSGEFFAWDVDFLILPIVEYTPNSSIFSTNTDCNSACLSYTSADILNHKMYNETIFNGGNNTISIDWADGNTTMYPDTCHQYATSGTYATTIQESTGWATTCLVNQSLNITPYSTDASISQTGLTLAANSVGDSYQWLDCNNAYSELNGETNSSFTATNNGSYALAITQNGCIDTSDCVVISTVDIHELDIENTTSIYPNPNNGKMTIDLGSLTDISIEVFNIYGQLVYQEKNIGTTLYHFELNQPSGTYLVRINSSRVQQYHTIIVND